MHAIGNSYLGWVLYASSVVLDTIVVDHYLGTVTCYLSSDAHQLPAELYCTERDSDGMNE